MKKIVFLAALLIAAVCLGFMFLPFVVVAPIEEQPLDITHTIIVPLILWITGALVMIYTLTTYVREQAKDQSQPDAL